VKDKLKFFFWSAFSGLLLALSFPKFDLFWIAWVALVPFFWSLRQVRGFRNAVLCGFAFGLVFFGFDLFWVNSLSRFVGVWAVLGWGALVLFQTLFTVLFALVVNPLDKSRGYKVALLPLDKSRGYKGYPLIAALLWVLVEWLRAWGPFGVTGGDVGYSQAAFLPLIQIAALTSVYGISFLVIFFNAALVELLFYKKKLPLIFSLLLILVAVGYGFWVLHSSVSGSPLVRLALIQPNIDQKEKIAPKKVFETYKILEELTRQAARAKPKIIIWPETAVFSYLLYDPVLYPRVKQLAFDTQAWLLVGTPHYERGRIYNSVVAISPSSEVVSRYDKEHLVPFGEYLPFRPLLYPFLKYVGYYDQEFSSNPQPLLIEVEGVKFGIVICFESTFPDLIRKRVKQGADLILTVTNDAWFGDSSAPYFHLNTGIFRAIENRKYFVQVANTGISAVIDPYGRILEKTMLNQQKILVFEIPLP